MLSPLFYVNSSRSTFASFTSFVSNPSVNHPYTGANSSRACCTLPWSRQRRARLMEARSLERIEWPSFRASRLNKSGAFALVDCSRHRLAEYFPRGTVDLLQLHLLDRGVIIDAGRD